MTWMPWGLPTFVFALCTCYAAYWVVTWRSGGLAVSNWFARVALVLFAVECAFCVAGLCGRLGQLSGAAESLGVIGVLFADVGIAAALGSVLASAFGTDRWVATTGRIAPAPNGATGLVVLYSSPGQQHACPYTPEPGQPAAGEVPLWYRRDRPQTFSVADPHHPGTAHGVLLWAVLALAGVGVLFVLVATFLH